MSAHVPNTICKNVNCTRGADGGRKHYYTCKFCVKSMNWRAIACCEECHSEYLEQVRAARSHGQELNAYPERTDLSQEEVRTLIYDTDLETVMEETHQELADEMVNHPELGIGEIIDMINQDE